MMLFSFTVFFVFKFLPAYSLPTGCEHHFTLIVM